jgi:Skp family chaperone for outer membrane proteins
MIEKRQEEFTKVRNDTEYTALLAEIEKEKRMKKINIRRNSSIDMAFVPIKIVTSTQDLAVNSESSSDEFDHNDKYGKVRQKDMDKITGGM